MILSFQLEIQAMTAIALRSLAREEQATEHWGQVWPKISFLRGADRLQRRFDAARS